LLKSPPEGPRSGTFSVFRNRDFALLFSGTLVSHTGDLLQSMAQSWLVFQLTHSAAKLGFLGFVQLLPPSAGSSSIASTGAGC
jgi:hypothetical protein